MQQFIDRVRHVLKFGRTRVDRTGTGTISTFGVLTRYDLMRMKLPIQTTKFVAMRPLAEEMFFFLRGDTNNEILREKKVNIWNQWALTEEDIKLTREQRESWALKTFGIKPHENMNDSEMSMMGIPSTHPGVAVGDLGPIYGAQWRHWSNGIPRKKLRDVLGNAHASTIEKIKMIEELLDDGEPDEYDQFQILIDNLRKFPFSRRHLITGWNPSVLPSEKFSPQENVIKGKQALPPCHTMFQFDVEDMTLEEMARWQADYDFLHNPDIVKLTLTTLGLSEKEAYHDAILSAMKEFSFEEVVQLRNDEGVPTKKLSCMLFQRSVDMGLGEGFNVPSYGLMTRLVAQCVGMAAGEFIHVTGNTHIYKNHMEGIEKQLERTPNILPDLWINPAIKNLDDFTMNDFEVRNYVYQPGIKFEVSV